MLTNDYWIVKLDSSGTLEWQNTIGGNGNDYLHSVQQTNDGGYILGGFSGSDISGNKTQQNLGGWDYWVVKVDSIGNIIWQKNIGGTEYDMLRQLKQTNDGGYILAGGSGSNISGDKTENCIGYWDYWVIKLFPDSTTSITQLPNTQLPFSISPNPSSGIFQITFPSSSYQKTNYTIEVINTLGQTVFQSAIKQTDPDSHRDDVHLDVSFLPKGLYLLKAITPEKTFSKIIIIH